ncbi:molybdopterin-dependent oxidoreductase [Bradyrhizobium australiense]
MSMQTRRVAIITFVVTACLAFAFTCLPETGIAQEHPILTISGRINASDAEAGLTFRRSDLEAMGMVSFETSTPWYKHPVKFEGVPLDKLMKNVGATGQRVVAMALNDYSTEIPVEDFAKYNAILAIKRDGEYMPIRDKGPLFIVYPYDTDPELRSQKFYSRSAWQVNRLIVK